MNDSFGTENVKKLIWKLAPPVMLAQLVQALYNIIDSCFIGKYSDDGLTALSIIFPLQLLITALAVGTGVGVNTLIAKYNGEGRSQQAEQVKKAGNTTVILNWAIFCIILFLIIKTYINISTESESVRLMAKNYGYIVSFFSVGLFAESMWTKILQAEGNMKLPMTAQLAGAVTNIILDPILIFGFWKIPAMGVTGAAIATVVGQSIAAVITGIYAFTGFAGLTLLKQYIKSIYKTGFPSIIMQALYTVYIAGLNFILAAFSDAAVTVLGLYYKLQTFLFIPLFALEHCIVPILSYNYAAGKHHRCKQIMNTSIFISVVSMTLGAIIFAGFPEMLIRIFTQSPEILAIGKTAFRIIGISFFPASFSLLYPVYFQAISRFKESVALTVLRQVLLLVPLAWIFSRFGLTFFWLSFPVSESICLITGVILYKKQQKRIEDFTQ